MEHALHLGSVARCWAARAPQLRAQDAKTEGARIHLKAAIAYYDEARYEDAAREMEAAYQLQAAARSAVQPGAVLRAARALRPTPPRPTRLTCTTIRRRAIASWSRRASATCASARRRQRPARRSRRCHRRRRRWCSRPSSSTRRRRRRPGAASRIGGVRAGRRWALGALASGIAFAVLARQNADAVTKGGSTTNPPPFDGGRA